MNIALVEANDDDVTKPVHEARKQALASLDGGGHLVKKLFGAQATEADLNKAYLAIPGDFGLISGLGHGSSTEFTGHEQRTVLSTQKTAASIKGAVVHLFSCNCGNQLGANLVANGAKAFIGYTDYVQVPDDATLTPYFVQASAAIDKAIAAGEGSFSTKAKAEVAYASARQDLLVAPSSTPADVAALESNHAALVGPWTDSTKWGQF